eukprot:g23431.t1
MSIWSGHQKWIVGQTPYHVSGVLNEKSKTLSPSWRPSCGLLVTLPPDLGLELGASVSGATRSEQPRRRKVLNPSDSGQGSLVPSLNQLLNPNLQLLRSWLDPMLFERLLLKIFLVCIGCYIVKLSCGSWLQGIRSRDDQVHALSQEAVTLCNYFAGMSKKPLGASEECGLWEPGRVLNVLHAVLQLPGDKWRCES